MKHLPATHMKVALAKIGPVGRIAITSMALLAVVGIGVADIYLGQEISLSVLYLLPIAVSTWYAGKPVGLAICLASTVAVVLEHFVNGYAMANPISTAWQAIVHLVFMLSFIWLFDRLHELLEAQEEMATADPLTGVLNRRAFKDRLAYIFRLAEREDMPVTLIYIDVDNFKQVNDRFGHAAGDRVLLNLADSLIHSVRKSDLVCRLGGDEFAVVLPDSDGWHARHSAEKLRQVLSGALHFPPVMATCSIGCVTFMTPPADMETALAAGDALMYSVKKRGKNQIAFNDMGR
jgi:diguanylate cyclase (GGDEF)-like protein